uniref:Sodium/potassium-transporting ATPase subunit beta-3 n=1 Tax=Parascaris univalens TaxID=6257 RepID=A0A915AGS3_PARUN
LLYDKEVSLDFRPEMIFGRCWLSTMAFGRSGLNADQI